MENTVNARALPSGTILNDQYEIKRILGEGGFGITYLAYDNYLKIKVAIKEYFPSQFSSRDTTSGTKEITVISGEMSRYYEKGLNDYKTEGNRLTKFNNLDGIVSVLNFFFENNTAYMVMEYVDGITLKEYLKNRGNKLDWRKTLEMFRPVINSFEIIHRAGIIHRDISPDNIMISKDGRMTIIDFGAARNDDDEKSKTIMLKKGYAPPEQYVKNGNQGTWTDVYALCATIYRMITGERPQESIAIKAGSAKLTPIRSYIKNIPDRLEKALSRGLEIDISNRIKTMEELEGYLYGNKRIGISKKQLKLIIRVALGVIVGAVVITGGVILGKKIVNNRAADSSESTLINPHEYDDKTSAGTEEGNVVVAQADDTVEVTEQDTEQDIEQRYNEQMSYVESVFSGIDEMSAELIQYETTEEGVIINSFDVSVTEAKLPSTIDGRNVIQVNGIGSNTTLLYIPEGVKTIGSKAFRNCVYLEKVYIPESVENIGEDAFENTQSLNEIIVSVKSENYYVEEKALYSKGGEVVHS